MALEAARANPREAAEASASEASGEEGEEENGEEGEVELDGEDVYAVQDIAAKRRQRGVTQYLIHWKG